MKTGKRNLLPYPKHLRGDVNGEFANNIMKRLLMTAAGRPLGYRCNFCMGHGYLEGRLNNYECPECGGQGGPPISWYDLRGRVMSKKEKNAWSQT